mmetsp:Transcript_65150/g.149446  ORF Transcript_65150/g.149446 Transcript_65150/m.149446 type:complete len:229 (-) Transcript_65150:622-1308(-)
MGKCPSRSSKYSPKSCWDTHKFTSPSLDASLTSRQHRSTCSTAHCTPPATSGAIPLSNQASVMVTPAAESGTPSGPPSPAARKSSCKLRVACTPATDNRGWPAIRVATTARTSRKAGAVFRSCLASSSLAAPSSPSSSTNTCRIAWSCSLAASSSGDDSAEPQAWVKVRAHASSSTTSLGTLETWNRIEAPPIVAPNMRIRLCRLVNSSSLNVQPFSVACNKAAQFTK